MSFPLRIMLTEQMKQIYISSMVLRRNDKLFIENYLKLISGDNITKEETLKKQSYKKNRINQESKLN